uniref:NADH-ubiquinone oxidoreductase chain 2 n=1 Tax=Kalotermitidae sp. 5 AB-2022a TaxID=2942737 RepID=A0A8X8RH58_9NEOP|nr:NADH dehydrogenase subunit 2 [Kalotermitidae sp. 5 AB-2022a]
MPNNPNKILLSMTLISGILISVSSNSWLGAWMGLEINLLSFIPLMSTQGNIFTTEASLKYFIVQALASSTLLFLVMMKSLSNQVTPIDNGMYNYMIMTPLLMKTGAAPLHWWFPSVMEGLSWTNCLLMMTLQKIAPMMLISYTLSLNLPTLTAILTSVIVGAMGGMNQTSLRKILTYSSINHTGWMLAAMVGGDNLWLLYFAIYSLLTTTVTLITKAYNISFINQAMTISMETTIKYMLFTTMLSLGGLPPFIGFLPKWIVIQMMIANNLSLAMTTMVIASLATLYYYLRVCYSSFILLHSEPKWGTQGYTNNKTILSSVLLSAASLMGLILCTTVINIS